MNNSTRECRSPLGRLPDPPPPRLYDRVVEVLRARRCSRRTEEACVHWIHRFIHADAHRLLEQPPNRTGGFTKARKSKQLPVVLTRDEVEAFLAHLDGVPSLVCSSVLGRPG